MYWTTKITVIDNETGEIITLDHVKKGLYTVIQKQTKNQKDNDYRGTKYITYICERNRQTKLEF